ncbi:hypothetical protein SAE02_16440 [Skermanella aerolata]|uniref:Uncharacterized protein n=1 Tax=Skermanella aerolata TaxID=393310 RepID=A0A512DLZ6_9PROT|nr:hypothetical protein [Skermanella aerolata]KJB96468.1 hypothetical protein N826_35720 [Skermanella aerolata KACC 11604]GEO37496.1 hypothetical protein SAE02_16440 [Skermanella aerolata]
MSRENSKSELANEIRLGRSARRGGVEIVHISRGKSYVRVDKNEARHALRSAGKRVLSNSQTAKK